MGQQEGTGYCPTCQRWVLVRRQTPSHVAHAIATVFLCGLWAIPWLGFTIFREPYRCGYCGSAGVYGGDV